MYTLVQVHTSHRHSFRQQSHPTNQIHIHIHVPRALATLTRRNAQPRTFTLHTSSHVRSSNSHRTTTYTTHHTPCKFHTSHRNHTRHKQHHAHSHCTHRCKFACQPHVTVQPHTRHRTNTSPALKRHSTQINANTNTNTQSHRTFPCHSHVTAQVQSVSSRRVSPVRICRAGPQPDTTHTNNTRSAASTHTQLFTHIHISHRRTSRYHNSNTSTYTSFPPLTPQSTSTTIHLTMSHIQQQHVTTTYTPHRQTSHTSPKHTQHTHLTPCWFLLYSSCVVPQPTLKQFTPAQCPPSTTKSFTQHTPPTYITAQEKTHTAHRHVVCFSTTHTLHCTSSHIVLQLGRVCNNHTHWFTINHKDNIWTPERLTLTIEMNKNFHIHFFGSTKRSHLVFAGRLALTPQTDSKFIVVGGSSTKQRSCWST